MQPTLYIAQDDRVIAVNDGVTRIGRSMTADIELEDMTVSRRHALIVRGEGRTVLLDDGSRNGVRLNGERIKRAEPLSDGDVIAVGRNELRYAAGVRALTLA
jgi:pSer/pThr/pTyr-binding forkhead associated (FHA) protein